MIQSKIKELKEINKLIDLRNLSDISIESHKERRDQLICEALINNTEDWVLAENYINSGFVNTVKIINKSYIKL